jgi:acetyl-CoA carboxylase alpha subunit
MFLGPEAAPAVAMSEAETAAPMMKMQAADLRSLRLIGDVKSVPPLGAQSDSVPHPSRPRAVLAAPKPTFS